jgi:heme-binding NEAT domain protein
MKVLQIDQQENSKTMKVLQINQQKNFKNMKVLQTNKKTLNTRRAFQIS